VAGFSLGILAGLIVHALAAFPLALALPALLTGLKLFHAPSSGLMAAIFACIAAFLVALWSAKTCAGRNLHDSCCRFWLFPAIVPTNLQAMLSTGFRTQAQAQIAALFRRSATFSVAREIQGCGHHGLSPHLQ
jgi:hypothetical protein